MNNPFNNTTSRARALVESAKLQRQIDELEAEESKQYQPGTPEYIRNLVNSHARQAKIKELTAQKAKYFFEDISEVPIKSTALDTKNAFAPKIDGQSIRDTYKAGQTVGLSPVTNPLPTADKPAASPYQQTKIDGQSVRDMYKQRNGIVEQPAVSPTVYPSKTPKVSDVNRNPEQAKADAALAVELQSAQKEADQIRAEKAAYNKNKPFVSPTDTEAYKAHLLANAAYDERIKAAEAKITELQNKQYYNKQSQKIATYGIVRDNPDYSAVVSGYNPADINADSYDKIKIKTALDDNYRMKRSAQQVTGTQGQSEAYLGYLNDDEKKTLSYYAAKGDWNKAADYLDALKRDLEARQNKQLTAHQERLAYDNPALGVVSNVVTTAGAPMAYFANFGQAIKNAITGEYEPTNPNSTWFNAANVSANTSKGVTSRAYDEAYKATGSKFWGDVAATAAGAGMSVLQNASLLPLGPTGALIGMGLSAAGQTTTDALRRGATPNQALALGTLSGGIELITEKIPLDNLFKLINSAGKNAAKRTVGQMIKQILKQMGTEGIEETIAEFAGNIVDQAVMGGKSEYSLYVKKLMEGGLSEQEANKEATNQFYLYNVLQSGLGGALSGGVMGAGATAAGAYKLYKYDTGRGKTYRESVSDLIASGIESETGTESHKLATILRERLKGGKAVSDAEIGRLARYNDHAIAGENRTAFLSANGETNAKPISDIISVILSGESISNKQAETIIASPAALSYLEQATGKTIDRNATMSEQRKSVKNILRGVSDDVLSKAEAAIAETNALAYEAAVSRNNGDVHTANSLQDEAEAVAKESIDEVRNSDKPIDEKKQAIDKLIATLKAVKEKKAEPLVIETAPAAQPTQTTDKPVQPIADEIKPESAQTPTPEEVAPTQAETAQTEPVEIQPVQQETAEQQTQTGEMIPEQVQPETAQEAERPEMQTTETEPAPAAQEQPMATEDNNQPEPAKPNKITVADVPITISKDGDVFKVKPGKYLRYPDFKRFREQMESIGGEYIKGEGTFRFTSNPNELIDKTDNVTDVTQLETAPTPQPAIQSEPAKEDPTIAKTPDTVYNNGNEQTEQPAQRPAGDASEQTKATGDEKSHKTAQYVAERLKERKPITRQELNSYAESVYGKTLASGELTIKDINDAMELGVNQYILSMDASAKEYSAVGMMELMGLLPTQTNRTWEQEKFQQFSTPPSIAYLVNYAANIQKSDTVLEPSAGIGGIAVFAKKAGAKVIVNELDKRRLEIIKNLPFDEFYNENAEQLDNILGDKIKPTVVVMNPPFSSSAARNVKEHSLGAKHVEEALKVLQDGGRLVAVVGRGMNAEAASFKDWWNTIKQQYNVRANIGLDGKNYSKYGTSFDIQLLVIDKTGSTTGEVVTGNVETIQQLQTKLEDIRNDRQITKTPGTSKQPQSSTGKPASEETAQTGKPSTTVSVPDATPAVGDGKRGNNTGAGGSQESGGGTDNVSSAGTDVSPSGKPGGQRGSTGGGRPSDASQDSGRNGDNTDRKPASGEVSGEQLKEPTAKVETGSKKAPIKKAELTDSIFDVYTPQKLNIKGAKPHPSKISESSAMAAIEPPDLTYVPKIPQSLIDGGVLSEVQLEAISYAGQSHSQTLPDGRTRGFFIGDGTGVGKGREIAGIILDRFNQGDKKAVWISENKGLLSDAKRDINAIHGTDKMIIPFEGGAKADKVMNADSGILFATYSTIAKDYDSKESNFNKLIKWLGKDYDGVIVFDESHNMANAVSTKGKRGKTKPSQIALSGIALQQALPKAKIVYSSATGATEVSNLRYAERLGLWGQGTAFIDGNAFVDQINAGGIAAMEVVSRSMKAMGVYVSRNLSYDGVGYRRLTHNLTASQKRDYNDLSDAWAVIVKNINAALQITSGNKNSGEKSRAKSAFWGAQQRFFNQIVTSMQVPTLIKDMEKQIANGKSIVIQLTSTNEAHMKRELAALEANNESLDEYDATPKSMIIEYLEKSFPIYQYETYTDEEGNEVSRPVTDSAGNPVVNRRALALRDEMITKVNMLKYPDSPIDMIINHFGKENVAENTGRGQRVVFDENGSRIIEKLPSNKDADVQAFQDGKKRIIIFSEAGGTGKSYHADKNAKNQQQRIHYLLQAGWKADVAVQGFGRSHRSNQVIAPEFVLLNTDLSGQKRFISTIARRLDQLGALTKGQKQTGSQGIFSSTDNLEGPLSEAALEVLYRTIGDKDIITRMGLDSIYDKHGNINNSSADLHDVNKFLNRIFMLQFDEQNRVFDTFDQILQNAVEKAIADGTYNQGLENYKADRVHVEETQDIKTDENSGAKTQYYQLTAYNKLNPLQYADIDMDSNKYVGILHSKKGGIRAVYTTADSTDAFGNITQNYRVISPRNKAETIQRTKLREWKEVKGEEAKTLWNEAVAKVPAETKTKVHVIGGEMLSVWDRLPMENVKIRRFLLDDGTQLIGRTIPEKQIDETLRRIGISRTKETVTGEQALQSIKNGSTVKLVNGWTIRQRKVSGENRIEIEGPGYYDMQVIANRYKLFTEKIGYIMRLFVPNNESAASILEQLFKSFPVDTLTDANSDNEYFFGGKNLWKSPASEEKHFNDLVKALAESRGIKVVIDDKINPDGAFVYADGSYASPFYSKLAREIDTAKQDKFAANGLIPYLLGKGVKQDEIKWLGLESFIEGKKSVTKAELLEYVKANDIQIEETEISNSENTLQPDGTVIAATALGTDGERIYFYVNTDTFEVTVSSGDEIEYGDTPDNAEEAFEIIGTYRNLDEFEYTAEYNPDNNIITPQKVPEKTKYHKYTADGRGNKNYREVLFTMPDAAGEFKSPHWDAKNVIAHTRLQDFTDADGNKVLFVEEVQSDWHEEGREKGYQTTPKLTIGEYKRQSNGYDIAEVRDENDNLIANIIPINRPTLKGKVTDGYYVDASNGARIGQYDSEEKALDAISRYETARFGEVPDAPFKTTWHELVLKRILRMAAEGGYDKVAWTTGSMQAERYSLERHFESITAEPNSEGQPNKYDIVSYTENDFDLKYTGTWTPAEVVNIFGKDIGTRLVEGADKDGFIKLTGDGLKVGGEGMKNFYDIGGRSSQNIPKFLQKYTKPWGAEIGTTTLETGDTVPSVTITDKMRESVLYEGQARFSLSSTPNAYYDPATKTIHISREAAKSPTVLLGHELYHSLSDDDQARIAWFFRENTDTQSEAFKAFKKERTEAYQALYGDRQFTEKDFWQEYAAENCETLFTDESYIKKLAGKSRNLAQKILDFIREIWARLRGETFRYSGASQAGQLTADVLRKAEKMYADALGVQSSGLTDTVKAPSLSEMASAMKNITGVPWNIGKVNKRNALGIYKTQPETMRTKMALDIPTASHELGHHFDKKHEFSGNTDSEYIQELVDLYGKDLSANYSEEKIPGEAVAEYFREFMSDRQKTMEKAPLFTQELYNSITDKERDGLLKLSDMFNAYLTSSITQKYKMSEQTDNYVGDINISHVRRVLTAAKQAPGRAFHDWRMFWTVRWLDRFAPIKDAEQQIAKAAGQKSNNTVYKKVSLLARVDNIAYQAIAGTEVHGLNWRPLGIPSLAAITNEYFKSKQDEDNYRQYHKLNRALTLDERALKTYADAELQNPENMLKEIIRLETENPWLPKCLNDVVEWQQIVGQEFMVNSGLISQELFDRLWEQDPYYIPFYRVMDADMPFGGSKKGIVNLPDVIKRMIGSGWDTKDVLENLGTSIANMVKAGMRNSVANDLADVMTMHDGTGGFMEKIPPSRYKVTIGTEDVLDRIEKLLDDEKAQKEMGIDDTDAAMDLISEAVGDNLSTWRVGNQKSNVVRVMRNGKPVYFEVHDNNLLKAITEISPATSLLKPIAKFTRGFKVLTTGVNPIFLIRNPLRDIKPAFVKSTTTNNLAKHIGDDLLSIGSIIRNSEEYKAYLDAGGGYVGSVTEGSRKMRQAVKAAKFGGVNGNLFTRAFRKYGAGIEAVGRIIELTDQVNRFAEYRRVKEAGGSEVEAQYRAARSGVDFSVGGTWAKQLDKFIPYFNATITSMYQSMQTLTTNAASDGKNKVVASWMKYIGTGMLSVGLMALLNFKLAPLVFDEDEEDIKEALAKTSAHMKNNYWLIYNGNKNFLRLPKSQSDDFVFSVVERLIENQFNKESFYNMDDYARNVLLPWLNIILLSDIYKLGTNKSWRGSPIVPMSLTSLDPRLQYNEKTTPFAIALGDALNISPMKIDYALDQNTGVIYDVMNAVLSGENKFKWFTDAFKVDSVYSTDAISKFYEDKDRFDRNAKSYKATEGKDSRYSLSDVYNSYKYGKYADLYSAVKSHIDSAANEEDKRDMRYGINLVIDGVTKAGMTPLDKKVFKIVEQSGINASDIAPYITVPEKITLTYKEKDEKGNPKKEELFLDYNDTMEYNKRAASLFADVYRQLFDIYEKGGVDVSTFAEVLKEYKQDITDKVREEMAVIILEREQ